MGAALTQRPDLFRAVLCEFPDLDMIGYWRFPNNNPPALLEYGDASKPDQFTFLRAYSPYQTVAPGTKYPAVLLTTGDADTRVPPLQARKMTARLQAATTLGTARAAALRHEGRPCRRPAAGQDSSTTRHWRWRFSPGSSECAEERARASAP